MILVRKGDDVIVMIAPIMYTDTPFISVEDNGDKVNFMERDYYMVSVDPPPGVAIQKYRYESGQFVELPIILETTEPEPIIDPNITFPIT